MAVDFAVVDSSNFAAIALLSVQGLERCPQAELLECRLKLRQATVIALDLELCLKLRQATLLIAQVFDRCVE